MHRRTFLKVAGVGCLSVAAGCGSRPEKTLFSLVETPDDVVTGKAGWYASTCRECPAGCGILAKNREGRAIKIEGNPIHPINRGRLCMRGQAALQGIYSPDRIKTPLLKRDGGWTPISLAEAEGHLKERLSKAAEKGTNRVRMMTEMCGEALLDLFAESLRHWESEGPLVFEPYAYESLKTANHKVFGHGGLPSYRMENADFLLSFGADFLETWLSPVEYAAKFKEMHAARDGRKATFVHVSPYQSLTGANADLWLSCKPGGEAAVALGLIRESFHAGKAAAFTGSNLDALENAVRRYTVERVVQEADVEPGAYKRLVQAVLRAERPLILGTGSGGAAPNAFSTQIAANLLNLIFDPRLTLLDFQRRHRVEAAARQADVLALVKELDNDRADVLLLNNVNPLFVLPEAAGLQGILEKESLFVVSFGNFLDETTAMADLIIPVQLALETWDEYAGLRGIVSTLQPAMASLTGSPAIGDLLIRARSNDGSSEDFKSYLYRHLMTKGHLKDESEWVALLAQGGDFPSAPQSSETSISILPEGIAESLSFADDLPKDSLVLMAAPSIRFFDGRGANRPWLCEIPDPLTRVAWQTPVLIHPQTCASQALKQGDVVRIRAGDRSREAPVYETEYLKPGLLVMAIGQGHTAYGRYAEGAGANPFSLLALRPDPLSGGPCFAEAPVTVEKTGRTVRLAHTDGSRVPHGRKIALSVEIGELQGSEAREEKEGLAMWSFPFTLPLPESHDRRRDAYSPHDHAGYRWGMVIDLDRCIGCGACAAACYAENNLGVVGLESIVRGREMAWLSIERYHDPSQIEKITFLPMLCQHCDNAPCESVCPVYAAHHSKEGLNNQIYNRCIGTRFCSQNCPYKVRRFNWYDWQRPAPLNLQLNPDVTVRSKGVMEKCSFCVQRIKEAHGTAKDEKREIRYGEIQTACLQTCPTKAIAFGNLMDKDSRVRKMTEDRRAYQVMGYLNTKPAVIYLKKVRQEV